MNTERTIDAWLETKADDATIVPVHVTEAIDRGLAKVPMHRPGSARALWEALVGAREPDPSTRILHPNPP